ncbi:hypothetical protein BDK92_4609 [Micromonospora pisi]|uniref:Uncharacterized protein n=1 Tax=Micromonospora pisi TaxID=589240 RepID=A0A495JN51_9ACTN|nr:hypothetical protein [Micromonospora pisi]RKR90241.1 hypothetical protein BDK92_4609 [Micromonospora pisi]
MSDRTASIDDLLGTGEPFGYEPEPQPTVTRRRFRLGWWIRAVLLAAGFTAVTVVGLRMFSLGISVPAAFAGWLALLLLRRATGQVAPPPRRTVRPLHSSGADDGMYHFGSIDALRAAVNVWENRLIGSEARGRYAEAVHPDLGELVDERLRQRHGLTRATEPERARKLLGEQVWKFLDSPPKRTPPPRELAAIVAQLEKL